MKLQHFLAAAALFASIGLPARAITIPVSEDTASTGATLTAGISAGGHLTKAAGKATTLKVAPNASAFIRFDAGPILGGSVDPADVTGARLTLYFPSVKTAGDLGVSLVTSDWTETVTTNTDQPTMSAPFTTIIGERVVAKAFVIVDVTAQVKAWLTTPATDFGFAILAKDTANVTLGAKEGSGAGYPATLEIDTRAAVTSLDGSVITAGSISASKLASNLTLAGTTSGTFSGNGSAVTNLSAANITGQLSASQLASDLTLGGTTSGTFAGDAAGLTLGGQALSTVFAKTDEKLRMIRGVILTVAGQAGTTSGTGFTFTHPSAGTYNINYNTAFTDTPAVTVSPSTGGVNSVPVIAIVNPNGYGSTQVVFRDLSGNLLDPSLFSFIAFGKP